MKFGLHITARDWDTFAHRCQRAEEAGFTHLWVAETPFFAQDPYIALAQAASVTSKCLLGPGCTNVVLRHEVIAASGLASVDSVSGGRAVCGIGSGDRAVRLLGKRPTRVAEMRTTIDRFRRLWQGEDVAYDDHTVRLSWTSRQLPIYLFAEGPRTLALAGETADAVVVGSGITENVVAWASECLQKGAAEAGRNSLPDVWLACFASLADDEGTARDAIRPRLANRVRHNFIAAPDLVPPEHQEECRSLVAAFDLKEWHQAHQASLVTDYMVDRFTLAGPSSSVRAKIDVLESQGVTGLLVNLSPEEFDAQLGRFSEEVVSLVN